MPQHPIETLFFDAAGTLFELREPVGQTYAAVGRQHGILMDTSDAEAAFRQAWKEAPRLVYPRGANPGERDRLDADWWRKLVRNTIRRSTTLPSPKRFEAYFRELFTFYAEPSSWKLYPETLQVLESLKKHYFLAIVSNFDARLEKLTAGLGIDRHVHAVYYSSQLGALKPDPAIFHAALRASGARAERSLHIGDDPEQDDLGARQAGLRSVLLDRSRQNLREALDFLLSPGH